jgi:hypothetical protein
MQAMLKLLHYQENGENKGCQMARLPNGKVAKWGTPKKYKKNKTSFFYFTYHQLESFE